MNHYHIKIRDRWRGDITWIADFIMLARSEHEAFIIIKAAYPYALEHHAKQITFEDPPGD